MKKLAGIVVLLASGSVAAGQAVTTTAQGARAAIAYWTTGYAGGTRRCRMSGAGRARRAAESP